MHVNVSESEKNEAKIGYEMGRIEVNIDAGTEIKCVIRCVHTIKRSVGAKTHRAIGILRTRIVTTNAPSETSVADSRIHKRK